MKTFIPTIFSQDKVEDYLSFLDSEFKYTQNNIKNNSYHVSIPKWFLKTEKLKEIFQNFQKYIKEISLLDRMAL